MAGLSVAADSLSAVRQGGCTRSVTSGLIVDYRIEGDFPAYGNDDDRVDELATRLVETFMTKAPGHDVSRRRAHPVGAHDHVERRLRATPRRHCADGRGRASRSPRRAIR